MSQRRPFEYIEVDVDYCALTYGSAPCTAALGATGPRKCFNMFRHCQDQGNFSRETLTLRFCKSVAGIPVDAQFFPCLERVRTRSSSVNIGGADERLSAFGRRAALDVTLRDFPYHDRALDKYQAERVSGAAQESGVGYNPADVGSFFTRLLARWPYYAGRSVRKVDAYLDGGVVTAVKTSHFIITDFEVDRNQTVTLRARDPLDLASNKKAVVPKPTGGSLAADVGLGLLSFDLSPEGIGDTDYPASGHALIGSEYVSFTRSGDTLTLTGRALEGSEEEEHSEGDKVQVGFRLEGVRVDTALRLLFVDCAGIDPAFVPDAKWQAEIDRWAPDLTIKTDIVETEGVADLVAEFSVLGLSVWWDDTLQEIGLKMVRPIDGDTLHVLCENTAIKEISVDHRQSDRLTEVLVSTVLKSPDEDPDKSKSYLRGRYLVDALAKSANAYGDTRFREINCRLLNQGNDSIVRVFGRRILKQFRDAPKRYELLLDAKNRDIALTDVLQVDCCAVTNEDGSPAQTLMQVVQIEDRRPGHDFTVIAQEYTYSGRFCYAMQNDAPVYSLASDAQKALGFFAVDENTLTFPDNTDPYEAI